MLDNTAKLSDIITELQSLEGINQKVDLKSALVAKGINATDTDSMADLISKLNSANLVLNGKREASGTSNLIGTGSSNKWQISVSGLSFTPKIIIVEFVPTGLGYQAGRKTYYSISINALLNKIEGFVYGVSSESSNYNDWIVANGSFSTYLNIGSTSGSYTANWIAFE